MKATFDSSEIPAAAAGGGAGAGETKVDRLVKHCVFEISTGAWKPGLRLPSVRQAARAWAVGNLTVLEAYRRLVALGLVRSVERSGYFVADTVDSVPPPYHAALERLHDEFAERLGRLGRGAVSKLGAFRYLAAIAERRAHESPECAFVECTDFQADMHAREISARLRVPVRVVTTDALAEAGVPPGVRTVVTTGFHRAEVERACARRVRVATVTIEMSRALVTNLSAWADEVWFYATDDEVAAHVARDAHELSSGEFDADSRAVAVEDVEPAIRRALRKKRRGVVLSPSLWRAAPTALQRHAQTAPLEMQLVPSAWPALARELGLPELVG